MKKIIPLAISALILLCGFWFYHKINSTQPNSQIRVTNLPWQITLINRQTLRVFDLNIGSDTLARAVKTLKSEYQLAWFDNPDKSISLEAYFFRVNLSGLRAKIILELDSQQLDIPYLQQHSGKPEILTSRAIKYPLDDLAQNLSNRTIRSLTYVPKSSVDPELIKQRFGQAEEIKHLNDNTEFWLYPQQGLIITINKKGKEAFQYIPIADYKRLQQSIIKTLEHFAQ